MTPNTSSSQAGQDEGELGSAPTAIQWRPATSSDLEDMAKLEADLFPVDAWSIEVFQQEFDLVPETRSYWVGREVPRDPLDALDHDGSGPLVGYAGISFLGPESEIMTFAITRSHQGQGLGTQFLKKLVNLARVHECKQMFLEVRADNNAAFALYNRAGFIEGERRKRYYNDGVDAILMSKDLGYEDHHGLKSTDQNSAS
ncbi:MAG: ribosomal protein S18-alanine N-acetyltransferase [Candidatus Nanopelagicales bacterium]